MKLGNAKEMMEKAYKDKPMHSDKNNIIEEFCDMIVSGALIAEWDVKEVKCRYKVNLENSFWTSDNYPPSKWNEQGNEKIDREESYFKKCINKRMYFSVY